MAHLQLLLLQKLLRLGRTLRRARGSIKLEVRPRKYGRPSCLHVVARVTTRSLSAALSGVQRCQDVVGASCRQKIPLNCQPGGHDAALRDRRGQPLRRLAVKRANAKSARMRRSHLYSSVSSIVRERVRERDPMEHGPCAHLSHAGARARASRAGWGWGCRSGLGRTRYGYAYDLSRLRG